MKKILTYFLLKLLINSKTNNLMNLTFENYRRNLFLIQANEALLTLRNNEVLWQEEIAERKAWEQTLADRIEKASIRIGKSSSPNNPK